MKKRKPELDLGWYQTYNADGELVPLYALSTEELINELACCYDLIQDLQDNEEMFQKLGAWFNRADKFMEGE